MTEYAWGEMAQIETLKAERDQWERRAYKAEADAHDLTRWHDRALERASRAEADRDHAWGVSEYWRKDSKFAAIFFESARGWRDEAKALAERFERYKEYTSAGFATMYREREFGPTPGAPRTEGIIDDYIPEHYPVRRVVVYPLPPRESFEDATRDASRGPEGMGPMEFLEALAGVPTGGHAQGTLVIDEEVFVGTIPYAPPLSYVFKAHERTFSRPAAELWEGLDRPVFG